MQIKKLIKKNILGLTAYEPGKPVEEVERQLGLKNIIKLASNENPLGSSPKAVLAIRKNLDKINRYPDGNGFYLKKALSKYFKLDCENFILGNGSDEIIDIIIKTFLKVGEEVITADVTFLEYAIITKANAGKIKTVPLKNFCYDLVKIKEEITPKTKLIFIANPNNPTGTYINKDEINKFLKGLSENIIVVFDEAYTEFVTAKDFPDSLDYFRQDKNIIILRTFSKAYGLAGLRVGFGIAKEEFIGFMERVRQPFNVNSLAQVGAVAALKDTAFIEKTKKIIQDGKLYFYYQLKRLGLEFIPTEANFILIKVRSNGKKVFERMLKEGVIIRDMEQYGLRDFIRVTIGTRRENERFIKVLKKVRKNDYCFTA